MKFDKLEIQLKSRGWGENEEFYYSGQIRFVGDDRSLITLQIPESKIKEFMRLGIEIFENTSREKIEFLLNELKQPEQKD